MLRASDDEHMMTKQRAELTHKVTHTASSSQRLHTVRGGSNGWPRGHAPCESCASPPNETGCKVARLHNTCIYSVASHSWCQITPFTQSCITSSGILPPPKSKYRSGHPAGHPNLLQLETPPAHSSNIIAKHQ